MFCATFYSYKGGVGRTLALANIAVLLARRRKKVLLVDFDLEAPGVPTIEAFASSAEKPGLVDFVSEFLASDIVPDVTDYIHACDVADPIGGGNHLQIDVMPAGRFDDAYEARFGGIDWKLLYGARHGFLLMEDMRAQWEKAGYDYVLIDSRTGHTDIGGICTRQLPDATVIVFFPNEQNLGGLKAIVEGVRSASSRDQSIELMFVASRVPRLDDEYSVLKKWMLRFQVDLDYSDDQLLRVDHYDSLMLLDQELFVLKRPSSGLARQYQAIADRLIRMNNQDADGAVSYANWIREQEESLINEENEDQYIDALSKAFARLASIIEKHTDDYVVLHAVANACLQLGNYEMAAQSADRGIGAIGKTRTTAKIDDSLIAGLLHNIRLKASVFIEDIIPGVESAKALIASPTATSSMVIEAIQMLANHSSTDMPSAEMIASLGNSSPKKIAEVGTRISNIAGVSNLAAELIERALADGCWAWIPPSEVGQLQMALIAGRRHNTAVKLSENFERGFDIADRFNTAVAKWGKDGLPDVSEFLQIIELSLASDDYLSASPNFNQCIGLAYAVCGDSIRSLEKINAAIDLMSGPVRREFSCWTYKIVSKSEFIDHCTRVVLFAEGKGPGPDVVS